MLRAWAIIALALSACGPVGEPVLGWAGVTYQADHGVVTEAQVSYALAQAVDVLGELSPWPASQVRGAIVPVYVHVVDDVVASRAEPGEGGLSWDEAGEVAVPRAMGPLAHELLHLTSYRLTGQDSAEHVGPTWARLSEIEREYRARLSF